jgi:glucose/arabinose dehydrogenase
VRLIPILSGYTRPVAIAHAWVDDDVREVQERPGRRPRAVRVRRPLDGAGLLDDVHRAALAFHPDYERNGRFYVDYTRRGSGGAHGDTVVAEYRRGTGGRADPGSARTVLVINQPFANHNGGHLLFGPDGYLYIGTGDGGSGGDPQGNGQNRDTLLGKLLRIDPLDPDGAGPKRFRIPASNPLVGRAGRDAIWSWGLRNPWRFSFDRRNGDLWIGDVGQDAFEEVDRSRVNANGRNAGKGRNYGWNRCEGKHRYPDTSRRCRFGTLPVHDYQQGTARCSVTGGHVHRGPAATRWHGLYVAGDFCGRLFVLGAKGAVRLSRNTDLRFTTFGEDFAGRIFAAHLGGTIHLLRFAGPRP